MTTSEQIRRRMAEDPAYAQEMQRVLHKKLMEVPWHAEAHLTPEEIAVAIFVCRYFDSFGPQPVRQLTCGCCTNGCVCWNHQDTPRGIPPKKCELHK